MTCVENTTHASLQAENNEEYPLEVKIETRKSTAEKGRNKEMSRTTELNQLDTQLNLLLDYARMSNEVSK